MLFFYLSGLDGSRCVVTSSWVRPDNWHRFPKSYITKFISLICFRKYFNFKNIKYISSMIVDLWKAMASQELSTFAIQGKFCIIHLIILTFNF